MILKHKTYPIFAVTNFFTRAKQMPVDCNVGFFYACFVITLYGATPPCTGCNGLCNCPCESSSAGKVAPFFIAPCNKNFKVMTNLKKSPTTELDALIDLRDFIITADKLSVNLMEVHYAALYQSEIDIDADLKYGLQMLFLLSEKIKQIETFNEA